MKKIILIFVFFFFSVSWAQNCVTDSNHFQDDSPFLYDQFPDGFLFSTATAAYQIEGGWNADGKGPSTADVNFHKNPADTDNGTYPGAADIACDSYHKWAEDVQLMKNLGVNGYRFSISWPRILPDGTIKNINQKGIDYYNNMINALVAANITPQVTLYHGDLPQALDDQGGFLSPKFSDWFYDYANLTFSLFGDRVKMWLTWNEPLEMVIYTPPQNTYPYEVARILLLTHARVYRLYNSTYKPTQKGMVGMTLNCDWKDPYDVNNASDIEAAERSNQFMLGFFANPIFSPEGDWPPVMKDRIGYKSLMEGRNTSRLPEFTTDEINMIRGSADFFGLNHYSTWLARTFIHPTPSISYFDDYDTFETYDCAWPVPGSDWLHVVPWGLRKLLNFIKLHYPGYPIYMFENGCSDGNGSTDDPWRQYQMKHYMNNVLKAIKLDKVDVRGYNVWSLLDNFEWGSGFTLKFGIHYVDFLDPNRTRTPKDSAKLYAKIIKDNGFVADTSTTSSNMTATTTPTSSNMSAITTSTSSNMTATTTSTSSNMTATTTSTSSNTSAITTSTSSNMTATTASTSLNMTATTTPTSSNTSAITTSTSSNTFATTTPRSAIFNMFLIAFGFLVEFFVFCHF